MNVSIYFPSRHAVLLLTVSALLYFCSCTQQREEVFFNALDSAAAAALLPTTSDGEQLCFPFPEGSKAFELKNHSFSIRLPEQQYYVLSYTHKQKHSVETSSRISIRCSCAGPQEEGCDPVLYDGQLWCVGAADCADCGFEIKNEDNKVVSIQGLFNEGFSLGFEGQDWRSSDTLISAKAGVLYAPAAENMGFAFDGLFEVPQVRKGLVSMYNFIYENDIPNFLINNELFAPQGYSWVKVKLYGYRAAIPVPDSLLEARMSVLHAADRRLNCFCQDGKPCAIGSTLGAKYCEATLCESCRLRISE